jgi:hypothetical protein
MQTHQLTFAPRRIEKKCVHTLLVACLAFLVISCATTAQVEEIVNKANMLTLAPLQLQVSNPQSPDGSSAGSWQEEVARIDTFIEAHADQPTLTNQLRLRQAMLLMVNRQDNLALATFELIDPQYLTTSRDKALYDVHKELIWWFKSSSQPLNHDGLTKAENALQTLDAVNDMLPPEDEIRQYLEETRAWIAFAIAGSLPLAQIEKANDMLETGLIRFASIVSDDDINWIKTNTGTKMDTSVIPRALRLRLRAPFVVEQYRERAQEIGVEPQWESDAHTKSLLEAVPEP